LGFLLASFRCFVPTRALTFSMCVEFPVVFHMGDQAAAGDWRSPLTQPPALAVVCSLLKRRLFDTNVNGYVSMYKFEK